jgi:ABC-type phosphate transport system substrate-binding protein
VIKVFLLIVSLMLPPALGAKVKVIQHPSLQDWTLSRKDLRDIFSLYDTYWSTGKQIRVVLLPWGSETHRRFVRNVLQRSPSRFKSVVQQRVSRGLSHGYIAAKTSVEAASIVSLTEGAIGYGEDYLIIQIDTASGDGHVQTVTITN